MSDPRESLVGDHWDRHIKPGMVKSGVPEDGLASLRQSYVRAVLGNPKALEQVVAASEEDA